MSIDLFFVGEGFEWDEFASSPSGQNGFQGKGCHVKGFSRYDFIVPEYINRPNASYFKFCSEMSIDRDGDNDNGRFDPSNVSCERENDRSELWGRLAKDSWELRNAAKNKDLKGGALKSWEVAKDVVDLVEAYSPEIKEAGEKVLEVTKDTDYVKSRENAVRGGYSEYSELGFQ